MIGLVAQVSRRGVVAAVAVGVMSGCSGSGVEAAATTSPTPGAVEREQAARDSAALLAKYDSAGTTYPLLAGRLAPLRAEVAQHVRAFGGEPAAAPPAPVSPTPTPLAPTSVAISGSPTPAPPTTPAVTSAQTLASLATAE